MKNTLKILTFLFGFSLLFFSCDDGSSNSSNDSDDNGSNDSSSYQTSWTLSGMIDFTGFYGTAGTSDVKFAAFYDDSDDLDSTPIKVSEIITLGNAVSPGTDDISFTLNIDVSALTPDFNDRVELICWDDEDDNNEFDDTWSTYAEANASCPDFRDDYDCKIWFNNSSLYGEMGWKIQDDDTTDIEDIDITSSNSAFTNLDLNDGAIFW
ncbi:MAG: hypothetical protein PQJ59_06605 [Spirochaetales bacterium]|nr:hypothetical protein [Spirochaetales bacterium]